MGFTLSAIFPMRSTGRLWPNPVRCRPGSIADRRKYAKGINRPVAVIRATARATAVFRVQRSVGAEAQAQKKTASCCAVYGAALFQFLAIGLKFVETLSSVDQDGREPAQGKDRDDDVPKGAEILIQ